MKTLGIIANCRKARARDVVQEVARCAARQGIHLCFDAETGRLLDRADVPGEAEFFEKAEAVLVLGGDGTLLRVARDLHGRATPLIGGNIGGLGFLTSVAEEDLARALECLAADEFDVERRAVAECCVLQGDEEMARLRGLNEVVVARSPTSRIASIHLSIDGGAVTSYLCDGLIVATPTGSTGHSLSSGGPILLPGARAFVVSLICPHTLSSRPLVVPDRAEVIIAPGDGMEGLVLTVDGQTDRALAVDERVRVRRAEAPVNLIHLPGYSYFAVLRHKLGWRGSHVESAVERS